jgi:3',5'-cyclic AMP phosphodiesterase CpdA
MASIDLQIASDLHVEFWPGKDRFNFLKFPVKKPATSPTKKKAPRTINILALLGDICCTGADSDFARFKLFVDECLPHYDHVVIVPGNHEYYFTPDEKSEPTASNTMLACDRKIDAYCKANPKLHYLRNRVLKLKSKTKTYMLIGTPLWTNIPPEKASKVQAGMSDYDAIFVRDTKTKEIRHITPADVTALHKKSVSFIRRQLAKAEATKARAIVLTHHMPYINPAMHDPEIGCGYATDLRALIARPVYLWAYGHTHVKDHTVINKVPVVSNPKGYPRQPTKFDRAYTVRVT